MKIDKTEVVRRILVEHPDARNSDRILMIRYCQSIGYSLSKSYLDALYDKDAPKYETIGRIRRKLQHDNEELRGSKKVQEKRKEKEKDFRDYAHDGDASRLQ